MLQIINITQARKNLAKLIKQVKTTKEPVIIVQDSAPSVVLYPYTEVLEAEQKKQQLFKERFEKLLEEGKKIGKKYLKEKNIKEPLSEEDIYNLIKND